MQRTGDFTEGEEGVTLIAHSFWAGVPLRRPGGEGGRGQDALSGQSQSDHAHAVRPDTIREEWKRSSRWKFESRWKRQKGKNSKEHSSE